jgi:hypothetical protein
MIYSALYLKKKFFYDNVYTVINVFIILFWYLNTYLHSNTPYLDYGLVRLCIFAFFYGCRYLYNEKILATSPDFFELEILQKIESGYQIFDVSPIRITFSRRFTKFYLQWTPKNTAGSIRVLRFSPSTHG